MESATYHIGTTGYLSRKAYSRLLHKNNINLTMEQVGILNLLLENDRVSMQTLSEQSLRDNSTTTRIIDNLEKNNYVARKKYPADRRLNLITITEAGKDVIHKANEVGKSFVASVTHGLSDEEVNSMVSTIQKIKNNILRILDK